MCVTLARDDGFNTVGCLCVQETAGLLAASGSGGEHEDVHALRAQLAAQQQLLMEVLNGRRDLSAPPAGLQGGGASGFAGGCSFVPFAGNRLRALTGLSLRCALRYVMQWS